MEIRDCAAEMISLVWLSGVYALVWDLNGIKCKGDW